MTQWVIRPAVHSDVSELSEFAIDAFKSTFAFVGYADENQQRHLEATCSEAFFHEALHTSHVVIARIESRIAGYAKMGEVGLPIEPQPTAAKELHRLYVHPDYFGGGLAQALMRDVLEWSKSCVLYAGVYSENVRAQRFYTRYGFQKIGEYDYHVGEHVDREWIMRRSL